MGADSMGLLPIGSQRIFFILGMPPTAVEPATYRGCLVAYAFVGVGGWADYSAVLLLESGEEDAVERSYLPLRRTEMRRADIS